MAQRISSKDTSTKTVNKFYKILVHNVNSNASILDWGCGKYDKNQKMAESKNYKWLGYDPFNKTKEHNTKILKEARKLNLNYICCNNVLNVIDCDDEIDNIIKSMIDYASNNTELIFTIYEGKKTGIGKPTTRGYQRNERVANYKQRLEKYFSKVSRKGNILICKQSDKLL